MKIEIQGQQVTDENSQYIGDGAYAYVDKMNRLWVFTCNGIKVLDQICLEDDVFEALLRFYEHRKGNYNNDR